MSLDSFLGIEPDPDEELRRILPECHGFFGMTVDVWKLEATISSNPELWWKRPLKCKCGREATGYQLSRGYFCGRCYEVQSIVMRNGGQAGGGALR